MANNALVRAECAAMLYAVMETTARGLLYASAVVFLIALPAMLATPDLATPDLIGFLIKAYPLLRMLWIMAILFMLPFVAESRSVMLPWVRSRMAEQLNRRDKR